MKTRQSGLSLIELMISVVIGMLAMVFVMRSTVTFETNRRGTVGGSDSMQNGVVALFSMENDAAQAGWGLNDSTLLGCRGRFFDSQNYANANVGGGVAVTFAPVSVVFNGANPDQISFASGTSDAGSGGAQIDALGAAINANTFNIDTPANYFKQFDVLALAPVTTGGACANPATAGTCCALAQISNVPGGGTAISVANDGTTSTRFNPPGGLLAAYPAASGVTKVVNLGNGDHLALHTWDVNNGVFRLRATDLPGSSSTPASAVSGIVSIKALYGFDTRAGAAFLPDNGMQINQWSAGMIDADGDGVVGSLGDYQRMSALRLAVVARGREPEKPDSSGTCPNTTTVRPTVFASQQPAAIATVAIQVNVAVAGDPIDWTCYRYRVFETIVPLRNFGWKPS
jgi:type IV pilus assembly protein PilW